MNESILENKSFLLVTDIRFWENTYGSHMRIQGLVRVLSSLGDLKIFFLGSFHKRDKLRIQELSLRNTEFISYKSYSGLKLDISGPIMSEPFFKGKMIGDFSCALSAYLTENPVQTVIFEYIRLGYLSDACPPGTHTILDMHDVMSQRMLDLKQAGLKASIQIDPNSERQILQYFDCLLTISRHDDFYVKTEMGLQNALYVPYSIPIAPPSPRGLERRKLIFFGANSPANTTGLRWFLDQVMPILANMGFTLDVVGTVCASFEQRTDANVFLHGQCDDLQPFLDAADISINPVFVGGGLKIKCLDSLASGLPVVTTQEGAAGLDHAVGAGLFVARSRQEFLKQILHLAAHPKELNIIADLSRRFIEREFSDEATRQTLAKYFGVSSTYGPSSETLDHAI